jgi:hypothetical protein
MSPPKYLNLFDYIQQEIEYCLYMRSIYALGDMREGFVREHAKSGYIEVCMNVYSRTEPL